MQRKYYASRVSFAKVWSGFGVCFCLSGVVAERARVCFFMSGFLFFLDGDRVEKFSFLMFFDKKESGRSASVVKKYEGEYERLSF